MTHQHAQLEWHENQPYSSEFGDIYFSSDSGLDETQYVFLAHNQLKTRWENLKEDHFTIAETGFGTGLNFLCTWKLWRETAPPVRDCTSLALRSAHLTLMTYKKPFPFGLVLASLVMR